MKTFSGLSIRQVVLQSATIHPDWDHAMHLAYLDSEEGVETTVAVEAIVARTLEGLR